jgi:predicted Fe-Mo cluster-binding NifX family protein
VRIAAISDDGVTISQHFGRAPIYVVLTVEEGKVVKKETRSKVGHQNFATQEHQTAPGQRHGFDPGSEAKHRSMADAIADCDALLAGGMGYGAYESLKKYNIKPIVTDVADIDQAVQLYLAGNLPNLMDRVH